MLSHTKGVLISTDIPTKQLIELINEKFGKKIIIKDLDDTHVLIDPQYVDSLKKEVEKMFDANTYIKPIAGK